MGSLCTVGRARGPLRPRMVLGSLENKQEGGESSQDGTGDADRVVTSAKVSSRTGHLIQGWTGGMPADGILKVFSKFKSQTALKEVEIYPKHCGEILKYFQSFKQSSDIWGSLLSIQMFFRWICRGESGLPILFLRHLGSPSSDILEAPGLESDVSAHRKTRWPLAAQCRGCMMFPDARIPPPSLTQGQATDHRERWPSITVLVPLTALCDNWLIFFFNCRSNMWSLWWGNYTWFFLISWSFIVRK